MSTPRQTQRNAEPPALAVPSDVIDPDFDDPDQADAEFTAWRWPDRERSE
ncbi:hypothetical protein BwSF12_47280 [Bradyrhizobium ottawaense]|nr:hypothetical protein BwSF12_47280 [Bradyrhizobium ottawaense]GMO77760.1 hypothetical protein BwSF19_25100 [Bradyrhizobium ottawaense]